MNRQYEYLIKTWGGFYNDGYKNIHGMQEGYYFFQSKIDRTLFIKKLKRIERELHAFHLVIVKEEGCDVRLQTVARMIFTYNGEDISFAYNFGYAYPEDAAKYMFTNGNYGCDCNRSIFIQKIKPDFPELDCGDLISMRDLEVIRVMGTSESFDDGFGTEKVCNWDGYALETQ